MCEAELIKAKIDYLPVVPVLDLVTEKNRGGGGCAGAGPVLTSDPMGMLWD